MPRACLLAFLLLGCLLLAMAVDARGHSRHHRRHHRKAHTRFCTVNELKMFLEDKSQSGAQELLASTAGALFGELASFVAATVEFADDYSGNEVDGAHATNVANADAIYRNYIKDGSPFQVNLAYNQFNTYAGYRGDDASWPALAGDDNLHTYLEEKAGRRPATVPDREAAKTLLNRLRNIFREAVDECMVLMYRALKTRGDEFKFCDGEVTEVN
eukprot:gnl/Hemi2/21752_TR7259_c0_g1_i1.p1 gnl/Hemi2/21752_TR7259_c0_g1~~gnl/Hemi2/21752_TR7259_c0_g1_i1.p1  ORF type:complete len:235 (-),score=74.88 gnl/Hemi2/21752_TR7259_c0_g1_i1:75-719(-)